MCVSTICARQEEIIFKASAVIMRAGRKVAVARMELHDDHQRLLAVGTGTYLVG